MEGTRKLYIDMAAWDEPVKIDDFLVAIGQKQSNSVYHVAAVVAKPREKKRLVRYNLKVYKSDLPTALMRDEGQKIIPVYWYSRKKKCKVNL